MRSPAPRSRAARRFASGRRRGDADHGRCLPDNHVGRPCEVGTMPLGGVQRPDRDRVIARPRVPEPHVPAAGRQTPTRRAPARSAPPAANPTRTAKTAETGPKNDPIGSAAARTVSPACGRRPSAPSRARSCAFAATSSASPGRLHEARGLPVSTIAVRVSVGARAPLDGDGRVTLDCYGRVGNMAPPFGLWQLIRSRRRGSREIPTGRTQGVPMTSRSPSPSISLAARTFGYWRWR